MSEVCHIAHCGAADGTCAAIRTAIRGVIYSLPEAVASRLIVAINDDSASG
ncbi:hypothetical protein ACVJGD_006393 [Bradyrhizobium sp. USDA 10063]